MSRGVKNGKHSSHYTLVMVATVLKKSETLGTMQAQLMLFKASGGKRVTGNEDNQSRKRWG